MMAKDEWVKAAMGDDTVVVELLFRLKNHQQRQQHSSSSSKQQQQQRLLPPLKWGIRQRRSKWSSSSSSAAAAAVRFGRKEGDSARGSPTTPLSWSGGSAGSPSATADGSEESSRFSGRYASSGRSKATTVINGSTTTAKRSRRKKTFAQLKEEENLLLKESIHLKKEIATLHATFAEHRSKNESLKRMKVGFDMQSANNTIGNAAEISNVTMAASTFEKPRQSIVASTAEKPKESMIASSSTSLQPVTGNDPSASGSHQATVGESSQRDRGFVLPDLNMMPSVDDPGSETLYGAS